MMCMLKWIIIYALSCEQCYWKRLRDENEYIVLLCYRRHRTIDWVTMTSWLISHLCFNNRLHVEADSQVLFYLAYIDKTNCLGHLLAAIIKCYQTHYAVFEWDWVSVSSERASEFDIVQAKYDMKYVCLP